MPLLVRLPLSAIGVLLFALLPLFVGFAINNWFVVADVKNQVPPWRWKD